MASAVGAGSMAVTAQAPNAQSQLPSFDVVSIKPYGPNDMMIRIYTKPDGVAVSGMPMHMILREAFGMTNDRLLGEPGWVSAERFDIEAKVAPEDAPKLKGLTDRQRWAMLLPALEDRCALKFHHETRELTVYTLVVAKGGPKLQPSAPAGVGADQTAGQKPASAGVSASEKSFTISGHGQTTALIARWISLQLGSTVVDKTGLTGKYDYSLSFAPDESMKAGILPPGSGAGASPPEAEGPSIFTAVQEQLGLKLVARKEPVDVVVIDHFEQPTEN
jgi:bla regulator protein blaR1